MNLKYEFSLSSAQRSEADVIPRNLLRGEFINPQIPQISTDVFYYPQITQINADYYLYYCFN